MTKMVEKFVFLPLFSSFFFFLDKLFYVIQILFSFLV